MLGVDETTVRRDLGTKPNAANAATTPIETAENNSAETTGAANAAPAWFQDDADPSKLAKNRERQAKKLEGAEGCRWVSRP